MHEYQSLFSEKSKKKYFQISSAKYAKFCYYNNVLLLASGELFYESGASCLGVFLWARCLGASFMWDEVVLHPYKLYSVMPT